MCIHDHLISSVSFTWGENFQEFPARSMEICLTTICEMPSFWSRSETGQPCRLLPFCRFCLHFFRICVVISVLAMWTLTWALGVLCTAGWAAVLHLRCSQAGTFDTPLRPAGRLPPCDRKGAFHLVLAGHTYNKLGFKRQQLQLQTA